MSQITYKTANLNAQHYCAFFYVDAHKYPSAVVILPKSFIETGKITTDILNKSKFGHTQKNITERDQFGSFDDHNNHDILNALADIFSQKISGSADSYPYREVIDHLNSLQHPFSDNFKELVCTGCAVLFGNEFGHNRIDAYNIYASKLNIDLLTRSRSSEKLINRNVDKLRKYISSSVLLERIKIYFGSSFPIDLLDKVISS